MTKGDRSNNSNFFMNSHSGTHVDAPLHFVKDGISVEKLPLEILVGESLVIDLSGIQSITTADLEKKWPKEKVERLLLKTRNMRYWEEGRNNFAEDYCALTEKTARWVLEKGVQLIGIDYFSIQLFGDSPIVHQLLLKDGVVVLEGINLSSVSEGWYELICLPLKATGLEAAPARAVLRKLSSRT